MRLHGEAGGLGTFFMRFAKCITIMRADCSGGFDDSGRYVQSNRVKIETRGLITNVKRRLRQDASGERVEGSIDYRVSDKVYTTSEDDIGAADIIMHEGSYWRVTSASPEGCDTVGSAVLLSDDQCVDLGFCR